MLTAKLDNAALPSVPLRSLALPRFGLPSIELSLSLAPLALAGAGNLLFVGSNAWPVVGAERR